MALGVGTRLGAYEITGDLGTGGMGEVYRATDTNLKREAAIKILPPAFASDADRIARFQREAEALAALNHSNIAQIYGLERSGDTTALAMELIEGPTLADRIAQGPIPVDEALHIAMQIANALEAAHEHNIVHRDLKPANIKLRPDGTVKVLDFGIATAPDSPVATSGRRSPALLTPALTEAGVLLGTAAYMSPEQARGRAVDQRADIWAFGCVLYEMLTGQPAFGAEDVTTTLARVLEREANTSALAPTVPAAVRHTVELCLEKDPSRRIADIRDVRLALTGRFETAAPPAPSSVTAPAPRGRLAWIVAAVAVLVAAALAVPAVRALRESSTPGANGAAARVEMNVPSGVELYTTSGEMAGVSPDGSRIAYVGVEGAVRGVYVRGLDDFATVRVRGTDTVSDCCAFSPDSRSLVFGLADGSVKKVSLADGLVTPLATGSNFTGIAWGSGDSIVFVRSQALWRVPASGGEAMQIAMSAPGSVARRLAWPIVLPGGAILFASSDLAQDNWQIESLQPATGERHTVIDRGTLPRYGPSGRLLFYRDGQLLAAPFDVRTQRVTGAAVKVLENLPAGNGGIPLLDVSAAGTLVYAPVTAAARLVWVSRRGVEQSVIDTPRSYQNPRLDPKGRWVLVQAGDLWLHDLMRATFTRVAADDLAVPAFPVLTPDGGRVVYKTTSALNWLALDGSGRGDAIAGTTNNDFPGSISSDGKLLLFVRLSPNTSGDIYEASLDGDADVRPLLQTTAYDGSAKLSPDGRWLAYSSNDSGRMEVYLRPFPAPDQRWQVSTQGGTQPIWNPNGREIFYRDDAKMMAVEVTLSTDAVPVLSEPELLFEQSYAYGAGITIPNYDVSADGQRFLMVKEDAGVRHLNIVLNWTQELEELAPAQ
jgi:eukaryotic-like serine/threonine-protein kinase